MMQSLEMLLISITICNVIYANTISISERHYPNCTNYQIQNKSSIFCERASAKRVQEFITKQNPKLVSLAKLTLRFTLIYPKELNLENIESLEIYRSIILQEKTVINDMFIEIQRLESILPSNGFQNFNKLKNLSLHHNQITSINSGAFSKLDNLQFLNLAFNKLRSINPNTFIDLLNLEVLDLRENQIETIYSQSFEKLQKLKILYFQGNYLSKLTNNLFTGLIHLQHLHLQENSISIVNSWALKDTINLEFLNISQNKIKFIEKNSFVKNNQKTINIIDLSRNKLETLGREVFDYLDLLQEIFLNDNPLICDCRIKWYTEWLSKTKKKARDQTLCTPVIESNMVPIMEASFEDCLEIDLQTEQYVNKFIPGNERHQILLEKVIYTNEKNIILHKESINVICELMQQRTYLMQINTSISIQSKYKVIKDTYKWNLGILESNICMKSLDGQLICILCYGEIKEDEKLYLNNMTCECLSPQERGMYEKENYYSPLVIGVLTGCLSLLLLAFIIYICRVVNKKSKKNADLSIEA